MLNVLMLNPVFNWLTQVQCVNGSLEHAPVSISWLRVTVPLMGFVAANACPVEVVGWVCRIKDARDTRSDKTRILAKGVAFLPVNAEVERGIMVS